MALRRSLSPRAWALSFSVLALGLSGCGTVADTALQSGTTSATDLLTFAGSGLPVAYVGEAYQGSVAVSGGAGPYGYKVVTGTLPPGLRLQSGALSGTPLKSGSYTFTVEANDANLSSKVQQFTLNVSALPPLSLGLTLPPSEIRGETRIPVVIKSPRQVRAARLSWDLGSGVQVTRVQAMNSSDLIIWKQEGTLLTLDLGLRSSPKTEARVALITLRPSQPTLLKADKLGYEARDGAGKLLSEQKRPGSEPPAPASAPAAATGTPASGTPATGTSAPATPATGTPATDKPASGTPASATPATGTSATPASTESTPGAAQNTLPSPSVPTPTAPAPSTPTPGTPAPTTPAPATPVPATPTTPTPTVPAPGSRP